MIASCIKCGTEFKTQPSLVKNGKGKYCSRKCVRAASSHNFDKKMLEEMYINRKMTSREIAKELNTDKVVILRYLKKYKIPVRNMHEAKYKNTEYIPNKDDLIRDYHENWLSFDKIANKYNIAKSTVENLFKRYKIEVRDFNVTRLGREYIEPTKEELVELYVEQQLNATEIGRVFNCQSPVILRRLKEHGIEARANIFGYDKLLECKDGHKVRSCYERAFDNALYRLGVDHEYEPRIPADKRYASDFKVGNVYVEIWGVQGNKKYEERKEKKRTLYKKHNLTLFEIYPEDFKNLYGKINELKRLIS